MEIVNILLIAALVLFLLWIFIILPYQMAERRNRSGILWVILTILISPLLTILLLLLLGRKTG